MSKTLPTKPVEDTLTFTYALQSVRMAQIYPKHTGRTQGVWQTRRRLGELGE